MKFPRKVALQDWQLNKIFPKTTREQTAWKTWTAWTRTPEHREERRRRGIASRLRVLAVSQAKNREPRVRTRRITRCFVDIQLRYWKRWLQGSVSRVLWYQPADSNSCLSTRLASVTAKLRIKWRSRFVFCRIWESVQSRPVSVCDRSVRKAGNHVIKRSGHDNI